MRVNGPFEFSLPSKPARYVGIGNHNGDCDENEHHRILHRGHSLFPFTFRFRHRKRCFAILDFSVELHTNFIPLNVFGYPPLSATASATRLTLEQSSKEKYGPIVRTSEGASSTS